VEKLKEVIPYYEIRSVTKPGITGWAQIKYPYGATVKDALEKLQFDIYYIKNMSPLLDIMIILMTIRVVVTGRGAR
jgi:lipopolysaccharide/colanic/teichoic acid biosynthesis glycosyltransferase